MLKETFNKETLKIYPTDTDVKGFFDAARAGDIATLNDYLFAFGNRIIEETEFVTDPSSHGETALMEAIRLNRPDSVKTLLDAGANPDKADHDGKSAIFYCILFSRPHFIAPLVVAGADIDKKDKHATTPLLLTTVQETTEGLQALLENGADFRMPTADGFTALDIVTELNKPKAIQLLKDRYATVIDADIATLTNGIAQAIPVTKGGLRLQNRRDGLS